MVSPFAVVVVGITLFGAGTPRRTYTRDKGFHKCTTLATCVLACLDSAQDQFVQISCKLWQGAFTSTCPEMIARARPRRSRSSNPSARSYLSDKLVQGLAQQSQQPASNERAVAEKYDITSPASICQFYQTFVKGWTEGGMHVEPPRVHAVVFCHECTHTVVWGPLRRSKPQRPEEADQ